MSNSEKIQEIIETTPNTQYEEIRKKMMSNNRRRIVKEKLLKFKTWLFDKWIELATLILTAITLFVTLLKQE